MEKSNSCVWCNVRKKEGNGNEWTERDDDYSPPPSSTPQMQRRRTRSTSRSRAPPPPRIPRIPRKRILPAINEQKTSGGDGSLDKELADINNKNLQDQEEYFDLDLPKGFKPRYEVRRELTVRVKEKKAGKMRKKKKKNLKICCRSGSADKWKLLLQKHFQKLVIVMAN